MNRLRWAMRAIGLPFLYALVVYWATRPPQPLYALAGKTVMTVTDQGSPCGSGAGASACQP